MTISKELTDILEEYAQMQKTIVEVEAAPGCNFLNLSGGLIQPYTFAKYYFDSANKLEQDTAKSESAIKEIKNHEAHLTGMQEMLKQNLNILKEYIKLIRDYRAFKDAELDPLRQGGLLGRLHSNDENHAEAYVRDAKELFLQQPPQIDSSSLPPRPSMTKSGRIRKFE